jgi:hypothetical protein
MLKVIHILRNGPICIQYVLDTDTKYMLTDLSNTITQKWPNLYPIRVGYGYKVHVMAQFISNMHWIWVRNLWLMNLSNPATKKWPSLIQGLNSAGNKE